MQTNYLDKVFSPEAFKGKVYGITGGGHGICEATARALGSLGASLLVIDFDAQSLGYVKKSLEQRNVPIEAVVGDVSDEQVLADSIERTVRRFGRLDGWVNGAMLSPRKKAEFQDEASFVHTWEVNVLAAWRAARLCLPHFRKIGGGSIVNISSIMAHMTRAECAAYTSTKSALEGLTRALAVELAPDLVRVNSMLPGTINTHSGVPDDPAVQTEEHRRAIELEREMGKYSQPLPFGAEAFEAAGPILFFLSDAARFVTGTMIYADGGASVQLANSVARHPELVEQLKVLQDELVVLRRKIRSKI